MKGDSKYFYASLIATPFGDELTADFAKTLIKAEKLGQGDQADFVAISFSVTDYIGHLFGPSSLEAEDNVLRLDRLLADLFQFVDREVGLENTLVILSSDHGMCEAPEYMKGLGFEVGRLTSETVVQGTIKKALQALGSWVVRRASRTAIPDAPSGFRALTRNAAMRINVFNEHTYTLETIIQAGIKNMAVASVPVRVNDPLRPSRLIRSVRSYIRASIVTMPPSRSSCHRSRRGCFPSICRSSKVSDASWSQPSRQ